MEWSGKQRSGNASPYKRIETIPLATTILSTDGLNVGTAGTATVRFPNNNTQEITLVQGWNPVSIIEVVSLGSAADVKACYG
jgi:hypothetical protein